MSEQVMVTGGSGFVGVHCIVRLLQAGYHVRTTLRSLRREDEVLSRRPIWVMTLAGTRPWQAAIMYCMWRRRFQQACPRTKTN